MPEIAEGMQNCPQIDLANTEEAIVARCVHYLRKTLVGKTLSVVKAPDDANVFGKVGTSGSEFEKAMTGKKVVDAGQQGKYFW
jgi:formamidopyrimidine-DNA glycosylase